MFDDLLKTRRDKFTLLEWADNGWLVEIKELNPFFIALLEYPYIRINKEEDEKGYLKMKAKFLAFSDSLLNAAISGEFPYYTTSNYHIPFSFDLAMPSENGNSFDFSMWVRFNRREFSKAFKLNYDLPIITRNDFKQWLREKGKWPVSRDSLLSRWFDYDYETYCLTSKATETDISEKPNPVAKTKETLTLTTRKLKEKENSREWPQLLYTVLRAYHEKHGYYPEWGVFSVFLIENSDSFGVKFDPAKCGTGKESMFKIGNLFPITKDNLKRTYNRLFETDNLEANKNKTESIQALMTVAPK